MELRLETTPQLCNIYKLTMYTSYFKKSTVGNLFAIISQSTVYKRHSFNSNIHSRYAIPWAIPTWIVKKGKRNHLWLRVLLFVQSKAIHSLFRLIPFYLIYSGCVGDAEKWDMGRLFPIIIHPSLACFMPNGHMGKIQKYTRGYMRSTATKVRKAFLLI